MAKKTKFGLGDGVEALFGAKTDVSATPSLANGGNGNGEITISIDKIRANPGQPRKTFDDAALHELSDSIRENGVIQPIIVEESGDGEYSIIAGERRFRASKLAGLDVIPALVRNYTPDERYAVSLIENIQREDLNPIEEALAYKTLMENANLSQDEAAARVGKNRSTLANAMRLLKLPKNIQDSLVEGEITAGHARAVLSVETAAMQKRVFEKIVALKLSVREAESFATEVAKGGSSDAASNGSEAASNAKITVTQQKRDSELDAMEQRFLEKLGTKVRIEGSLEKGYIKIDYYCGDDLDRINSILCEAGKAPC
ncbi:chromosome partitioning protein ParB [Spirochaetia bacterium]|nr:chromosome partitioning protein ParB [Spirochaetia bacterium]